MKRFRKKNAFLQEVYDTERRGSLIILRTAVMIKYVETYELNRIYSESEYLQIRMSR